MTLFHQYAPSNPGVTRILLVSSAAGIFISLRIFRISREKILIPVIAGGSLAILVSILTQSSSGRLTGVFSNANLLGSFAAGLIPVGFTFLFGKGWKRLSLLILFLIVCATALLMSGTRSSMAMATPGASTEYIATSALLRLQSQQDALAETHGEEEAKWIVIRILNSEIDYLGTGPFNPTAALVAQHLKSAFQAGEF
ncbi:MAG: hypothetical protein KAQ97_10515 [Candidatus Fermentibacteraceae bacterium]|nr:hypothetical protein [Candidatus Fermentibacteraceae bacterium]